MDDSLGAKGKDPETDGKNLGNMMKDLEDGEVGEDEELDVQICVEDGELQGFEEEENVAGGLDEEGEVNDQGQGRKEEGQLDKTDEELMEGEGVRKMMKELENIGEEVGCTTKVAVFVRPYVVRCVERRLRGKRFRSMEDFMKDEMVCRKCYHPNEPGKPRHLDSRTKVR